MKPADVDDAEIAFGTQVALTDLESNDEVTYTILGPWESDPTVNIINYQSPLGNRLLRNKPGDELDFEINEKRYHLRIDGVKVATFT